MKYFFRVVDADNGEDKVFDDPEKAVNYKEGLEIADQMNGFMPNYILQVIPERD